AATILAEEESFAPRVGELAHDPEPFVRASAGQSLAREFGCSPEVERFLRDPVRGVRLAVLNELSFSGDSGCATAAISEMFREDVYPIAFEHGVFHVLSAEPIAAAVAWLDRQSWRQVPSSDFEADRLEELS